MADLDALLAEARSLDILGHIRLNDVHCPNCHARLYTQGECVSCGLVGSDEAALRRMDPAKATALLERSIARRKKYVPEKRAKVQER